MFKKLTMGLMAGLISTALLTGCGGGSGGSSGSGGSGSGDDPKQPAATPSAQIEMKGEPTSTFQIGSKTAKLYELNGAKLKDRQDNFNLTGERIVFANGAIYLHGEVEKAGKDIKQLFKLPLNGDTVGEPEPVAESDGDDDDKRNLAVCRDKVLFKLIEGGKLAFYNGKSVDKSEGKWKDEYDGMVGFAETSDLLLVRSLDTICTAKQELSDIKGVKEVVKDARETLKLKDAGPLRPVYADVNEMFLSVEAEDGFTTDLIAVDKNGKLLNRYNGLKDDPADWAVTRHYLVQAGSQGDMLIYERETGKKVYDSKVRDFEPLHIYAIGGDMLLAYSDWSDKFFILDLK